MDQLRAFEVFCAVANASSFAGAARALSMSPPSVTRIIGDLEEHLGTTLFHRSTRSVVLTEIGMNYLADAQRVLEAVREADDAAKGARLRPTGTLRITAPILFGEYYVTPILREYCDLYPEVQVEATFLDRTVNLVDEGFDVAIRMGNLPDSSLRAVRVGGVRHIVCACPSYLDRHGVPAHPHDLKDHQIINFLGQSQNGIWRFDQGLSVRLAPRLNFSTVGPCIACAKAGWGITRLLSYQIGPQVGDGGLTSLLDDFSGVEWPVSLLHAEPRGQSAKVRSFMELAVERLRGDAFLN